MVGAALLEDDDEDGDRDRDGAEDEDEVELFKLVVDLILFCRAFCSAELRMSLMRKEPFLLVLTFEDGGCGGGAELVLLYGFELVLMVDDAFG